MKIRKIEWKQIAATSLHMGFVGGLRMFSYKLNINAHHYALEEEDRKRFKFVLTSTLPGCG